jgi:hypothetical protein
VAVLAISFVAQACSEPAEVAGDLPSFEATYVLVDGRNEDARTRVTHLDYRTAEDWREETLVDTAEVSTTGWREYRHPVLTEYSDIQDSSRTVEVDGNNRYEPLPGVWAWRVSKWQLKEDGWIPNADGTYSKTGDYVMECVAEFNLMECPPGFSGELSAVARYTSDRHGIVVEYEDIVDGKRVRHYQATSLEVKTAP